MTQHDHKHNQHGHQHHRSKKQVHKDWRLWAVVVLMLAAMLMYVVSDDESLQPNGQQAPVEAAP